jgi:hypothetical protein
MGNEDARPAFACDMASSVTTLSLTRIGESPGGRERAKRTPVERLDETILGNPRNHAETKQA